MACGKARKKKSSAVARCEINIALIIAVATFGIRNEAISERESGMFLRNAELENEIEKCTTDVTMNEMTSSDIHNVRHSSVLSTVHCFTDW